MNYIITNEQHYKDIADAIRTKLQVDSTYTPDKMANAINLIPSTSDGSNELVCGVYFYDPDKEGYPRRYKNIGTDVIGISGNGNAKNLEIIEFTDSCFMAQLPQNFLMSMEKLREVRLPNSITYLPYQVCDNLPLLQKINIPNSLKTAHTYSFTKCPNLEFVKIENGFNCNGLNLGSSGSTKFSREIIISWFNALKDRTGEVPYKFLIGSTNLAKLTAEDIKIGTDKNWTIA